jgi:L-iditol 2-dehydrogenase
MKAMALTGKEKIQMIDVPMPEISNDTDVLVKIKTVGICGSDIHYYTTGHIGSQIVVYPFVVGHESAGFIEAIGKKVTSVRIGDRIAIEPAMPCHNCEQCQSGRHNTCLNLKFLGCPGQADGTLKEYIVIPESSCFPITNNINFDQAAISEPLAIGVYAVKQSGIKKGDKIGILGFGPVGMSTLIAAKAKGIEKIYVTDKINARLKIAEKSGGSFCGNPDKTDIETEIIQKEAFGLDVVFECCGQQETLNNAFQILKPGGKLVIIGIPEFECWSIPVDLARRKEITIFNIRRQNHSLIETLDGLENGIFDVKLMPTHHFKFHETPQAFEMVKNYQDGVMKAIVEFD